ncbi:MAG: ankyrin repeat domain-containing protein [Planctomycetes bacterium]|nr:ankyrin repeat domain-containing protein [Planctomycetota bacterium]
MKHLLLTTIAAVLVVGCATTQQPEPPTAKAPDIDIYGAAYTGNIEAIKQHLVAGTDVNAKNEWGGTPLHFATFGSYKEVVELLIAKGADVNAKDGVGETPLHWAAKEGNKEVVELLISKGADVNAKDDVGDTPVDWADNKETADLLRKHGGKTKKELEAAGN